MVLLREPFFLRWQFRKNSLTFSSLGEHHPSPAPHEDCHHQLGILFDSEAILPEGFNRLANFWTCCQLLLRTCTFLFSQPPGAAALQPECKQRRIPNNICPTQAVSISPSVAIPLPWRTSAEYSSLHTCSATDLTLKTLSESQLFTLKLRNPPASLAPPSQAARSSWLLIRFYSLMNSLLGYDPFVVGEENNCWKFNRFLAVNSFQLDWRLY